MPGGVLYTVVVRCVRRVGRVKGMQAQKMMVLGDDPYPSL
jgi:hypothetical protein